MKTGTWVMHLHLRMIQNTQCMKNNEKLFIIVNKNKDKNRNKVSDSNKKMKRESFISRLL